MPYATCIPEALDLIWRGGRDPLKAMCNRLSRLKDHQVTPEQAPAHVEGLVAQQRAAGTLSDPDGWLATARVYAAYQHALRDANTADFGGLLLWPTVAMSRDHAYREPCRAG